MGIRNGNLGIGIWDNGTMKWEHGYKGVGNSVLNTLIFMFVNMAPDENDPRLEVPIFRLELATVYCKRFDMYFTARNITLNEDKMNLLLHNADQETTELILENPDYYYRVTWRQFKLRIKKLLKEKNLKTMIICKQKEEETSTWLEKMVKLASRGDIDE